MNLNRSLTMALIAHDSKKEALADFAFEHRAILRRFRLIATRGTGTLIRKRTGLTFHLLEAGPLGGDRQLGELAAQNEVQAAIFLRDPLSTRPHEPDFTDLLRVCDLQEIPLATNLSTAEALLYFLESSPNREVVTARPWGYAHSWGLSDGL